MLSMRLGFGLNTNLFETNVLNLAVVFRLVVTVLGDAFSTLLDQRRQSILTMLQEVDRKARDAQRRLEKAKGELRIARRTSEKIRTRAIQTVNEENQRSQKKTKGRFATP